MCYKCAFRNDGLKNFSIDYEKIDYVLDSGVKALGVAKSLSPTAVFDDIKGDDDYWNRVVNHFFQVEQQRGVK